MMIVSGRADLPTYGYDLIWHDRPGGTMAVATRGHLSAAEAFQDAMARAIRLGYERPRWWQWWRRGENNEYVPPADHRVECPTEPDLGERLGDRREGK